MAKKDIEVEVHELREDLNNTQGYAGRYGDVHYYEGPTTSSSNEGHPWIPGFKQNFPIISLGALIGVVACTVGIIIVLVLSDGKDVATWCSGSYTINILGKERMVSWSITVNVWISIFVFVAGKLMALAFAEALAISWWVGALRGKTLRNLTHDWDAGRSITAVILKPRLFSWICLASIAFTAFAGLGTVLQKSTSAHTVQSRYNAPMSAKLAGNLPIGFSGVVADQHSQQASFVKPDIAHIMEGHQSATPVQLDVQGCFGTSNVSCSATFRGVGFNYYCNETLEDIEPLYLREKGTTIWNNQSIWGVAFNYETTDLEYAMHLDLYRKVKMPCHGKVISKTRCKLKPALVEYPVNITSGAATLKSPEGGISWDHRTSFQETVSVDKVVKDLPWRALQLAKKKLANAPKIVPARASYYNADYPVTAGMNSTLGGLYTAFDILMGSKIWTTFEGTAYDIGEEGSLSPQFLKTEAKIDGYCSNVYEDALPTVIQGIRDLMFRSSVAIVQQNISEWAEGENLGPAPWVNHVDPNAYYLMYHTAYQTNFTFMGIGIVLIKLAVLAVLPLYWGFWRLGRKVSLSPLEIAKAMNLRSSEPSGAKSEKPLEKSLSVLGCSGSASGAEAGSNMTAKQLMDAVGDIQVQYGAIGHDQLGLTFAHNVDQPTEGQRYH